MEFQRVTRVPNPKAPFPNFSSRPPPFGLVPNAVAPHYRQLSRSDPSVLSGSSCCRTAGRTFRPPSIFISQKQTITRIRLQRKPKGESLVGQFEFRFHLHNATGLARQECAHLGRSADGRRNSEADVQVTRRMRLRGGTVDRAALVVDRRKRWAASRWRGSQPFKERTRRVRKSGAAR